MESLSNQYKPMNMTTYQPDAASHPQANWAQCTEISNKLGSLESNSRGSSSIKSDDGGHIRKRPPIARPKPITSDINEKWCENIAKSAQEFMSSLSNDIKFSDEFKKALSKESGHDKDEAIKKLRAVLIDYEYTKDLNTDKFRELKNLSKILEGCNLTDLNYLLELTLLSDLEETNSTCEELYENSLESESIRMTL